MNDLLRPSKGIIAFGIFLLFGAIMASLAGASLVWQGTFLDRMWTLNPTAYVVLAPLGKTIGTAFLLLGAILATTGILWLKRCLWGWRLAVILMATEVLGNLINMFRGDVLGGLVGFAITAALLFYLLRPRVKAAFGHTQPDTAR
jgi:hypothetical protein